MSVLENMKIHNQERIQNSRLFKIPFLDVFEGNEKIKELLLCESPVMIGRLGSVEINTILEHYSGGCSDVTTYTLLNNAGFNPKCGIDKLADLYKSSLQNVDLLGGWNFYGEAKLLNESKIAQVTMLRALEPYYFENPWSVVLENKKVLVIHPFENSIISQFEKKNVLHSKEVLPDFELLTIKAPLTTGNTDIDWFDELNIMKEKIEQIDFDIALIGCGAYGFPLASHVKTLGKKSVHMGGALQLLFGIKGKRWDNHNIISGFYNEHWVSPREDEKPMNWKNIESGCYW